MSFVLAMFIRAPALRLAVFTAYFLSLAVTFGIWLSYPTVMRRPPVPDGWWNWPYAVVASVDLPVHIFPAGHILMPAELVGAVGIFTTWQHRPIDVLYGAALAITAGLVFGVQRRRVTA